LKDLTAYSTDDAEGVDIVSILLQSALSAPSAVNIPQFMFNFVESNLIRVNSYPFVDRPL